MELKATLAENLNAVYSAVRSDDIKINKFNIGDKQAAIIFSDTLCDKKALGTLLIKPLSEFTGEVTEKNVLNKIFSPSLTVVHDVKAAVTEVAAGNTVLTIDGLTCAFSADVKCIEKRPVTEPPTATVLKGPREGFVENLQTNVCLIRRRIKSPSLKFEYVKKGEYSGTDIALVYIDGVVKEGLKEDVIKKLSQYSLDAVIDSSYVAKIITENKKSIFKQIGTTEKPDILCAKIMEGRLAIIVDGSPIALTVPYLMVEDFQSAQDYYASVYHANVSRILRVLAVFFAVMLPAFYVSAQIFHLQLIPLSFLLTIINGIKGIPLSPGMEMFLTLLIFEILNEASLRMPRYAGMVISIVGGLVLGETAVNAGIISPPALMIVAFSGICLYTVPDLEQVFAFIRALFLLISATVGAYGVLLASCFTMVYLTSKEFFNTPILAPFAPLIPADLKDSVYKTVLVGLKERPTVFRSKNRRRIKKTGN